ncbi:MAG: thioesterase family protein [Microthrixaceae bacterium]|nr:thioesterase family protein [Microthrixaceae bacterium]
MSRFLTDTSVTRIDEGRYRAKVDRGWWIVVGPNGGYVAALMARAITAEIRHSEPDDQAKRLRSLTVHYLRPPAVGDVAIDVVVERRGRRVSAVTARMSQDDALLVVAVAAVGAPREAYAFSEIDPPSAPSPEELPWVEPPDEDAAVVPINARYQILPCVGSASAQQPPADGPLPAVSGGWLRFGEPTPIDEVALTAITDAWFPPVFHRANEPLAVPTVDLTIHIHQLPADPMDWVLVRFASPMAHDGYMVEDGEIWDRAGNLLAVCRQLAIIL